MSYATIKLKMFKGGLLFSCEEVNIEDIVPLGDGDRLMELINEVDDLCNPDATYVLTEKGGEIKRRKQ